MFKKIFEYYMLYSYTFRISRYGIWDSPRRFLKWQSKIENSGFDKNSWTENTRSFFDFLCVLIFKSCRYCKNLKTRK